MKIECRLCGNKFDPLKNGGVCSKCGRLADEDDIKLAENNSKVKGGSLTEVIKSYLNERLKAEKKRSPLRAKKVQIPLCIILVLAIGGVWLHSYSEYKSAKESFRYYKSSNEMTVENYSMNDEIQLKDNFAKFISCKEISFGGSADISDGFKFIEITYERGLFKKEYNLSEAYLKCGESYTKPLDNFDLSDLMPQNNEEQLKLMGYHNRITAVGKDEEALGRIIFAVPENEREFTLSLFQMSAKKEYVQKVQKRLDIALKEEG